MPGHRFFTHFHKTDQKAVIQDADEFQHLSRVLRLKKGAEVELINGEGGLAKGVIADVGRSSADVFLSHVSLVARPAGTRIVLACAIPKKSKFETIIEKCTELGVDRIIPIVTERTEFSVDEERADRKVLRFQRVVMNAAKQCKRLWFPEVTAPVPFPEALREFEGRDAGLFIPWLEGERLGLADAVSRKKDAQELVFFIGPEGDFTPDEAALALGAGALPVSLGENVLKVDTAAMAVVAFARMNAR